MKNEIITNNNFILDYIKTNKNDKSVVLKLDDERKKEVYYLDTKKSDFRYEETVINIDKKNFKDIDIEKNNINTMELINILDELIIKSKEFCNHVSKHYLAKTGKTIGIIYNNDIESNYNILSELIKGNNVLPIISLIDINNKNIVAESIRTICTLILIATHNRTSNYNGNLLEPIIISSSYLINSSLEAKSGSNRKYNAMRLTSLSSISHEILIHIDEIHFPISMDNENIAFINEYKAIYNNAIKLSMLESAYETAKYPKLVFPLTQKRKHHMDSNIGSNIAREFLINCNAPYISYHIFRDTFFDDKNIENQKEYLLIVYDSCINMKNENKTNNVCELCRFSQDSLFIGQYTQKIYIMIPIVKKDIKEIHFERKMISQSEVDKLLNYEEPKTDKNKSKRKTKSHNNT